MTSKDLNLSEFNIDTENILAKENMKKERKVEKLEYKMQIGLTKNEYDVLYKEFEESGFTSFAGFIRMKLKKINFM